MIVVTGGAGFIGSHIVAALAQEKRDVLVSDFLGGGDKWRNLARHDVADIVSPPALLERLQKAPKDIEAIIHMGAISDTTEKNADLILHNNIRLSLDLLAWCTLHKRPFIYASSGATYGDGREGFDDDEGQEGLARLRPLNPYGWSKHMVDRRIASLKARKAPLPPQCVGLKFFNVYGPNEYHKGAMRSVVHQIFPDAAAGRPVKLFKSDNSQYADGGQLRDFVYVRDCIKTVSWFLENPRVSGLFNVGSGKARSFADLAKAVFAALGKAPHIEYVDMPVTLKGRYQYFTQANMQKLGRVGGPKDFTSLEDGVADYVLRYLCKEDAYA